MGMLSDVYVTMVIKRTNRALNVKTLMSAHWNPSDVNSPVKILQAATAVPVHR